MLVPYFPFVASAMCLARLGFSRCMISSPRGAVPTRIILRKMEGLSWATCCATIPPSENPRTSHLVTPKPFKKARTCCAIPYQTSSTRPCLPTVRHRHNRRGWLPDPPLAGPWWQGPSCRGSRWSAEGTAAAGLDHSRNDDMHNECRWRRGKASARKRCSRRSRPDYSLFDSFKFINLFAIGLI